MSEEATPDKALATLRARAALAGLELRTIEDDRGETAYICTRDAETRTFESMPGLSSWLDRIGVPA